MKSVLFVCVSNATRSQMAEGLAKNLLGSRMKFQSAGYLLAPLDPIAVKVLKEFNVDIASNHSKTGEEIERGSYDTVIYLCAEEACPLPDEATTNKIFWQMADPAATLGSEEHVVHAFRATRDKIYMKLKNLEKTLSQTP